MEDGWFLAVQNPEHSHGPTRVGSHPVLRKLTMRRCGLPLQFKIPAFRLLIGRISEFALKKTLKQYNKLILTSTVQQTCSEAFSTTMGLPCSHIIQKRLFHGETLTLKNFHPH